MVFNFCRVIELLKINTQSNQSDSTGQCNGGDKGIRLFAKAKSKWSDSGTLHYFDCPYKVQANYVHRIRVS